MLVDYPVQSRWGVPGLGFYNTTNRWLTCPDPNPRAAVRLFCFPYAGGGATIYRQWPQDLARRIELWPVQLPGRENRFSELAFTRLKPLVQTLVQVLRPYLDRPFAFFGHSLGALISFELANQLRLQGGVSPVHLFISGYRAPHLPNPHPLIHALPTPQFMTELRQLQGTPQELLEHQELMQLMLPLLRADFAIHETYTYSATEPLDCPLSVFGGWEDDRATYEELALWREHTRKRFQLQMFPGNHFFIRSARSALLQAIAQGLAPLSEAGTFEHSESSVQLALAGVVE